MKQESTANRRLERLLVPLLPLLYVAALVPYASVHPTPRLWVGLLCAAVGAVAAWYGLRARPLAWAPLGVLALLLVGLAAVAASLVPLDAAGRSALQPVVAEPVNRVLAMVGQEHHPLALEPRRALLALQFALGVALAGLGSAALVRTLRRSRTVAWVLVAAGVGCTALAALHWATDAPSIYRFSGVPAYARDPFFAPYVNPNQGGAACAALLPLALALMLRQELTHRLVAMGAAAVLVMGILASGSRGAVLEAGVAVVLFGVLLGSRTAQLLVGLGLASGLGAVIKLGPVAVAHRFSSWISPDWFEGDLLLGRGGIWHGTVRLVDGAPLLGVGAGSYEDAYPVVKSMPEFTTTAHAHQDYLQALAEHGVVGGGAWILAALVPLLLGVWACLRLHRGRRRSMLAGYVAGTSALLVSSLVTFSAHIGALAVLMAVLGGVVLARSSRKLAPPPGALGAGARWASVGAVPLCALLALGLSCFAGIAGRDPASPWAPSEDAVALGREAYERAKEAPDDLDALVEAEDWFRSALARRPLDPATLFELARVRWLGGQQQDAVALLELGTAAYPTLVWSWLHLGRLHRSLRQPEQAQQAYARLLALDLPSGESARPYLREALLTGDDPAAVLELVLPDRGERFRDAAAVMTERGEGDLAEALYLRALELEPDRTVPYASFLLRAYRYEEALALLGDKHEGCFANRTAGYTLLALDRYEESLVRLRAAQGFCGSDDVPIRAAIASARIGAGDAGALDVLRKLVQENPEAWGVRRSLVRALKDYGLYTEAIEHLEILVLEGVASHHENELYLSLRKGRLR